MTTADAPSPGDTLSVEQARKIADAIEYRREHLNEPLTTSVLVALFNAQSRHATVRCIGNEQWTGSKSDAQSTLSGLPVCPNGHPLIESGVGVCLGWVEDVAIGGPS